MYRGAGVVSGIVGVIETTNCAAPGSPVADCHPMPEGSGAALPVIEISDKDYRSFCWPCHDLEETGEGQTVT